MTPLVARRGRHDPKDRREEDRQRLWRVILGDRRLRERIEMALENKN